MEKETIVMHDAPEAATLRTVTGWVSRHGRFYGDAEDLARHDGCTHVACRDCGAPAPKNWLVCDQCRTKAAVARYAAMPRKAWDGVAMLYSQTRDAYFVDLDGAVDVLEEGETLDALRLVICEPNCGRPLREDYFSDELAEDGEVPDCLRKAIDAFNAAIDQAPPLSWSPGKWALDTAELPHKTIFSPCRTYRYALWREWEGGQGYAMFIGLNPSTADETQDDPTIRRCIDFAKAWGYAGLCMTNLFAFRATDPAVMKAAADPVGPENDAHLLALAEGAGVIVAAWGTNGTHLGRDAAVRQLLPGLHCLSLTGEGHPGHPLYLRKTLTPVPLETHAAATEGREGSVVVDKQLWAILIPGPDDVWAMPSKEAAVAAAAKHNRAIETGQLADRFCVPKESVQAQVIEWPHSAEDHAEALVNGESDTLIA